MPMIPLSALLGFVPFVAKHWRILGVVGVLLGSGIGLEYARRSGYEARLREEAAQQVLILKGRLATVTLQAANDAKRAADDQQTIEQLKQAAHETPPNSNACLDRAAVGRVRRVH